MLNLIISSSYLVRDLIKLVMFSMLNTFLFYVNVVIISTPPTAVFQSSIISSLPKSFIRNTNALISPSPRSPNCQDFTAFDSLPLNPQWGNFLKDKEVIERRREEGKGRRKKEMNTSFSLVICLVYIFRFKKFQ